MSSRPATRDRSVPRPPAAGGDPAGPARRGLAAGDAGSATLEGVAALGVAFLLMVLLIQVGAAMAARESAQAAVAVAARRASRPDADAAAESRRLTDVLHAAVPGATDITARVRRDDTEAVAVAEFRIVPPGPHWVPLVVRVDARSALVVPP